jgi:hypothetical protein
MKYTLIALLYVNTILAFCNFVMYSGASHKYKENMKIKKAAAQVLNFPDLSN